MSEPVAWMIKSKTGLIRTCWSEKPSDEQIEIAEFDGDTITPLYSADAIERNRAAIAELVWALKAIVDLDDGDKPDLWHYEAELDSARAAIAKYDNTKAVPMTPAKCRNALPLPGAFSPETTE